MAAAQHRFQPKLCHWAILSCGRFGAVRQVGRGQNRCEGGVSARSDLHHPPFPRQRIERESGLPRRARTPDRGDAQGWCAGRMRTSPISPERTRYMWEIPPRRRGGRDETLTAMRGSARTLPSDHNRPPSFAIDFDQISEPYPRLGPAHRRQHRQAAGAATRSCAASLAGEGARRDDRLPPRRQRPRDCDGAPLRSLPIPTRSIGPNVLNRPIHGL
jgi:hypothetical protein